MKQGNSIVALAALLALPGCFEQPEMPKPVASRLPEQVCQKVSEGMAKLDASGTVVRTQPTEISIEEQAWLQIPETTREQITKLIAFDAACKAAEPTMQQTVIVRSEYGQVMAQSTVATSADLSQFLKE